MEENEIQGIIEAFRSTVCGISDEEVKDVTALCRRKIEITGQDEGYMRLMLPDELKSHCFRRAINSISILRMYEGECVKCAVCV